MHVRIAWEIYHHQAKQNPDKTNPVKSEMLRQPSHMYAPPPGASMARPPDMPGGPYGGGMPGRSPFDPSPLPPSFMGGPASHMGEFFHGFLPVFLDFKTEFFCSRLWRVSLRPLHPVRCIAVCFHVAIRPRHADWNAAGPRSVARVSFATFSPSPNR
jgi:Autism susceptibility gene 2 protein